MYLSITMHGPDARDLGWLLHKHPERVFAREVPFGTAYVVFPEAGDGRTRAVLIHDVDPFLVARPRAAGRADTAPGYVSDRFYAAGSLLAVVMGRVYGTALAGRCDQRPGLAARPRPFDVETAPLRDCTSFDLAQAFFAPLGYTVAIERIPLDPAFPSLGMAEHGVLKLSNPSVTVRDLLCHLSVLLPAIDGDIHHFVDEAQAEQLERRGDGWLEGHPHRSRIEMRYLAGLRHGGRPAVSRPKPASDLLEDPAVKRGGPMPEEFLERTRRLSEMRLEAVTEEIVAVGAETVVDFGCGDGRLIAHLLRATGIRRIVGVDPSLEALERATSWLSLEAMTPGMRQRVDLLQGSVTLPDPRLGGADAVVLSEVIEHIDPWRLGDLVASVLRHLRPRMVLITTPNAEYNPMFPKLPKGAFRHADHRFEWTRTQFGAWCDFHIVPCGYTVRHRGIGSPHADLGAPTQIAVFQRRDA